jgi:signal transduction histidine kinase
VGAGFEAQGGGAAAVSGSADLASAVRAAAISAADLLGGGLALVFAAGPGDASQGEAIHLRAAAGFDSPQLALEAAQRLLPQVRESLGKTHPLPLEIDPALGARGVAGLAIHPLICGERVHGALAVAWPSAANGATGEALSELTSQLALRFDHARLAAEVSLLGASTATAHQGTDEKSDEILKLSEALFAQDIELLRSNEKLGKIEKLKNDFIEKMSRELRTPLNSIIEAIISVLTGENEAISDASKATLRSALDDGTSFLRTLQNILDLWRIKQGELPVEVQDVNLREIVNEAIFSVQDTIGDKPITVEQKIDENFPKIRTDVTKLNQIIFLLLDNAVKFTTRGRVEITARLDEERLTCEVRDTGIGICADDRSTIFDEFFQVDEPASQKYRGAGLGLTLVRDLVLLLGGEINVASEVGAGSNFSFAIPLQGVG